MKKQRSMLSTIQKILISSLILLVTSIASSDPQKITDVSLKIGQKAPFPGVLTHEDMYRYLRAEEQRAIDLETELIAANDKSRTPKLNYMIPLTIGLAVGAIGASYLTSKDVLIPLCVGMISGGAVVWSFQ